jgi:hypothetical protein
VRFKILAISVFLIVAVKACFFLGYLWAAHGGEPGIYQTRDAVQFYDDARDIRPSLAYDIEQVVSPSGRSITGGTVEPCGRFEVTRGVPFGAEIKVLSGRYRGDRGYVKTSALSKAKREIGR